MPLHLSLRASVTGSCPLSDIPLHIGPRVSGGYELDGSSNARMGKRVKGVENDATVRNRNDGWRMSNRYVAKDGSSGRWQWLIRFLGGSKGVEVDCRANNCYR